MFQVKSYIGNATRPFVVIFCLILLFFYNILTTNYYYIDDLGRSLEGYSGWSRNGRPLADLFFYVISFGSPLPDISPIPQVLGIASLSLGIYLTGKTYLGKYNRSFLVYLLCLPIALSPFYLENMSYKYDAFPMSLSVLCAMLPFVINIKGKTALFLICVVSLLVSLSLYQASMNIYIIYTILYVMMYFKKGSDIEGFKSIGISIAALVVSYEIYSFFISPYFIEGDYNIQHSQISSMSFNDLQAAISSNFKSFCFLLSTSMSIPLLVLTLCSAALAIICAVKLCVRKSDSAGIIRILRNIIILASPLLVLIMIAGPMLLLQSAVVSARVFVAFGVIIVFYNILACWMLGVHSKILWAISALYLAYMLGAAFSYGNALDNQEKFDNVVISTIISDLNNNGLANAKYISFVGRLPISPEGRVAINKYPFLMHLVHPTIDGRWSWGLRHIKHFDLKHDFNSSEYQASLKDIICNLQPITRGVVFNSYYDKNSDNVVYDFSKKKCE